MCLDNSFWQSIDQQILVPAPGGAPGGAEECTDGCACGSRRGKRSPRLNEPPTDATTAYLQEIHDERAAQRRTHAIKILMSFYTNHKHLQQMFEDNS